MDMPETHTVTPDNGPRPAGRPDECFYCRRPLGAEHKPDCVCRQRTVLVRMTVEYVMKEPAAFTIEDIDFHLNGSSRCANGALADLEIYTRGDSCLCGKTEFSYVREANPEEHEEWLALRALHGS